MKKIIAFAFLFASLLTTPVFAAKNEVKYSKINVKTEFAEDINPKDVTGYKVILTPVELDYLQDIAEIPKELLIPNPFKDQGEYEEYEMILSGNNEFTSYEKISHKRVINIKATVPNITVPDDYIYQAFGDDVYEIDFADKDPSGFYANKEWFIINDPGEEIDINFKVSKNPNPKRKSLDKANISKETKKMVESIYSTK